jgi:hypothetical protein
MEYGTNHSTTLFTERMNGVFPVDPLTLSWPWKQIDELLKMRESDWILTRGVLLVVAVNVSAFGL